MKYIIYCWLLLVLTGCKERYESPVQSPVTGYLVVDGVINSGPGAAGITLTRTTKFENKNIVYERSAVVKLEGEDNTLYSFAEKAAGQYGIDNLNLKTNTRYRLRINTANGKQYLSDYAAVKNNPPIDSISWKLENNGVQLYIHTHDPQNNTRYYQWVYDETWEFHSAYLSYLKYYTVPDRVKVNLYHVGYADSSTFSYNKNIVTCWQFNMPTSLSISSTAKLSKDVVYLPLAFITPGSIKLGVLYSIHVKQYAWTQDGYEFLDRIKKNTEATGTVFDPQPSELNGNIHCLTDATEPVVGYFNICPAQEKRIFISTMDVGGWNYRSNCYDVKIENNSDSIVQKGTTLMPTTVDDLNMFGGIATFRAAPYECVDCTLSGTNKKPSYWP